MYSRAPATWLSRLKWIHALLWLFSIISIVGLRCLVLYLNTKSNEIIRVALEASVLIYGNLVSVVLRILTSLVFILWQINLNSTNIQTPVNKILVLLKCLKVAIAEIPLIPFLAIAANAVSLRLAIASFASGGIEAPITKILLSAGSIAEGQNLIDSYTSEASFSSALLRELSAVSISIFTIFSFSLFTFYKWKKTKFHID